MHALLVLGKLRQLPHMHSHITGFDVWMANSQTNTYSRYNNQRSVYEYPTTWVSHAPLACLLHHANPS